MAAALASVAFVVSFVTTKYGAPLQAKSEPLGSAPSATPLAAVPVLAVPAEAPGAGGGPTLTRPADGDGPRPLSLKPLDAYRKNLANRPMPRVGATPNLISAAWRAQHERQLHASHRAKARLVFLGDSITESWGVAPAYRDYFGKYAPLNLGIAGDTTQNVMWRIQHGALDGTQPKVVVILLGINNLAGGFSAEATSDGVRAVLTAVQTRLPDARVLLLGILPAGHDRKQPTPPPRRGRQSLPGQPRRS